MIGLIEITRPAHLTYGALSYWRSGTGVLFGQASDLGHVGSVALIGAHGFMQNHIYWPGGVLSKFALALGWGLLLLEVRPATDE